MADVAVVAHSRKSFGGGSPELREILAREGVTDPLWHEVKKPPRARIRPPVAARGVDVMFVWVVAAALSSAVLTRWRGRTRQWRSCPRARRTSSRRTRQIPDDLTEAVRVGLHGDRCRMDTGSVNGEHFTVMAGAGSMRA